MAHAAISHVIAEIIFPKEITPAERWLLVIIADHVYRDGWSCRHSHKTLAKDAGMSVRTIVSHLSKLEEAGFISRAPRFRDDGTRTSDEITLLRYANVAERLCKDERDQVQLLSEPSADVAEQNLGLEPRLEPKKEADASSSPADQVFTLYNQIAERRGLPVASVFTGARRKSTLARIKDAGSLQAALDAVSSIETSRFLLGSTGWKAHFDFILQSSSFAKLVEGFYHEERHGKATGEFAGFDFGNGGYNGQRSGSGMADSAAFTGGRGRGAFSLGEYIARSHDLLDE